MGNNSPPNLCDILVRYEARKILLQNLSAFDVAKLDSVYSYSLLTIGERDVYLNPVRDLLWNLTEMAVLQNEGLNLILLGQDALALQQRLQNPERYSARRLQIYLIGTFPFQNKDSNTIDRMIQFTLNGSPSRTRILRDKTQLKRIERYDPDANSPFMMGFGVPVSRITRGCWHRVWDVPDLTVDLRVYVPSFEDRIQDEVRIPPLNLWRIFGGGWSTQISANETICESVATRSNLINDEVLLKVTAAALCGTDANHRESGMVLGHAGVGVVLKLGPDVRMLQQGDRVGWGYLPNSCVVNTEVNDDPTHQGAFNTKAIWKEEFLVRLPDHLIDIYAAPLMCAGNTVFSALITSDLPPGARVGILGMGGLGHLAIQFAVNLGLKVTVLSRTESKKSDALEYGAAEFHVFKTILELSLTEPLDLLLVTASGQLDWQHLPALMAPCGRILFLSTLEANTEVSPRSLVTQNLHSPSLEIAPRECSMQMLWFASESNVKPRVHLYPLTAEGITKAMMEMREELVRYHAVCIPRGT